MVKLNIGCGIMIKKGFINIDKYYTEEQLKGKSGYFSTVVFEKGAEYVQADVCDLPFDDGYADYAESIDMIEHLPMKMVVAALSEIRRVLKPKGTLVLITTDFAGFAADWLKMTGGPRFDAEQYIKLSEGIYGNQRYAGEFHCTPFSYRFMQECLKEAGFGTAIIEGFSKGAPCKSVIENKYSDGLLAYDMLKATATK